MNAAWHGTTTNGSAIRGGTSEADRERRKLLTRLSHGVHGVRWKSQCTARRAPSWTSAECDGRRYRNRREKHSQGNEARSCVACRRASPSIGKGQRKNKVSRYAEGYGQPLWGKCAAHIEHNAAFRKVAAFAPLRYARCNDRFAPCGFAERGVMSGAPPRLHRLIGALERAGIGQGHGARSCLACGRASPSVRRNATTNARPTPRRAHPRPVCPRAAGTRASGTRASSRRCAQSQRQPAPAHPGRHAGRGRAALLLPRPAGCPPVRPQGAPLTSKATPTPQLASGARDTPALHRMRERVSSIAVKGSLRRCAPLTERPPARRNQTSAAKEKTACLRARARAKMCL
jgi:hypothetical protein